MSSRSNRLLVEESIKSSSLDLIVGESVVGVCPFCLARHETSFSITRSEEGILYNCFRASCGARGFVSSGIWSMPLKRRKTKVFPAHVFDHALEELPTYVLDLLKINYELTKEELDEQGIKFCRAENRIFMPVFDYRAERFGGVTKSLTPSVKRFKTINYFDRESSRLSYPRRREGARKDKGIVIVEDILSAIKTNRFCRSVALLGHSINDNQIKELRGETDTIVLMLDGDVFEKALNLKKKFGFYFRNFFVKYMSKDPKDTDSTKLEEIIND